MSKQKSVPSITRSAPTVAGAAELRIPLVQIGGLPAQGVPGDPTGAVFSGIAGQFQVGTTASPTTLGTSNFIFDSEDGTISAWRGGSTAALVTVPVGAALAFPAMRVQGLYLALATLAFATMIDQIFYTQPFSISHGQVPVPPLHFLGMEFSSKRSLLLLVTVVFAVCGIGIVMLRRSAFGRRLVALRDSEAASVTVGVNVFETKLLVFSLSAGSYTGPVTVTLFDTTPGATIHYTLDSSEPTEASPLYTGPLTITASTDVRARAFAADSLPSKLVSHFYLILASNVQDVNSNLPIMVIHSFEGEITKDGEGEFQRDRRLPRNRPCAWL
jgi:hypothetical protein